VRSKRVEYKYRSGRCPCWDHVEEMLSRNNRQLVYREPYAADASGWLPHQVYLEIASQLIDESLEEVEPAAVVATYCPFCGEMLKEDTLPRASSN
jgi:hypothetical protein